MQSIFYSNQSGTAAFKGDLNSESIRQAITLHPLKESAAMLNVHNHFRRRKAGDLRFRHLQLSRDLLMSSKHIHTTQPSTSPYLKGIPFLLTIGNLLTTNSYLKKHPFRYTPCLVKKT